MHNKAAVGKQGEDYAAEFLLGQGMQILARNYRSRYGEVDIIATDGRVLCFVEVKTRRQNSMVGAWEAVTPAKRRRLIRTALLYLREHPADLQPRFDICGVATDAHGHILECNYLTGAFDCEGYL